MMNRLIDLGKNESRIQALKREIFGPQRHKIAIVGLWLGVFLAGYYLRAYFDIHYALPFSPYDAWLEKNWLNIFNLGSNTDLFTVKTFSYPLSHLLRYALGPLNNFYFIYLAGAVVIFLLGKEISGKAWGGFFAFALFAVSSENLLHYTKSLTPAGLNYVLSWLSLLLLLKYLRQAKDYYLLFFALTALLAIISYHTGAVALVVILTILILYLMSTTDHVDSKLAGVIFALLVFYAFWLLMFDIDEIILIRNAVMSTEALMSFGGGLILIWLLSWLVRQLRLGQYVWLASPYLPAASLVVAMLLIVVPFPLFNRWLALGVNHYYASTITLNNYMAQALVTHVYLLGLFGQWSHLTKPVKILLAAWLPALIVIFFGLTLENYYARIFDYSFPLMFILFGCYWSQQRQLRLVVVPATIILLFVSQLIIFNDPFSMRRYYTGSEVAAAQAVINYGVPGPTFTDLRTAALFGYLGDNQVQFMDKHDHQTVFYNYEDIKSRSSQLSVPSIFLIVSDAMRYIVYGDDFETQPVDQKFFDFMDQNFSVHYDAGQFTVYQIK